MRRRRQSGASRVCWAQAVRARGRCARPWPAKRGLARWRAGARKTGVFGRVWPWGCNRASHPYRGPGGPARSPCGRGESGGFSRQSSVAIGPVPAIVRADFVARSTVAAPPGASTTAPRTASTKDKEMFVPPAFAQASQTFGGDNLIVHLLPFVLIFVIMYFLILRPQQKRAKEHQELVKNLRRGDTVITSGGLVGKVTKVVDDDQIEVEIRSEEHTSELQSQSNLVCRLLLEKK